MNDWVDKVRNGSRARIAKTYFVVYSFLLPPGTTFVRANYLSRLGHFWFDGRWHILVCDVRRVRGTLLERRGKKRREGGKHDCLL